MADLPGQPTFFTMVLVAQASRLWSYVILSLVQSLTSCQSHPLKPPFAHLQEISLTRSQFQFGIRDLFPVNLDPAALD